jgi:hypothetical protein
MGFCAVWHEDASRAIPASAAIRTWSFVTCIFLYEIRISLERFPKDELIEIVPRATPWVNLQTDLWKLPSVPAIRLPQPCYSTACGS